MPEINEECQVVVTSFSELNGSEANDVESITGSTKKLSKVLINISFSGTNEFGCGWY